ncbi:MAG: hypothetical protein HZC41_08085 [Chloroflexi bacterium]|nr:hypothetical protein [Chloroflexota bacterium]
MNQKTLIIIVVVVVVLFFCGMGTGFIPKQGEGEGEPLNLDIGWVKGIGNLFGPRIGTGDVNTGFSTCPVSAIENKQLTLAQAASCTFAFRPSNTRARILKVELAVTNAPVGRAQYAPIPVDDTDFAVNATLVPARTEITFSIRQNGGTLTFICQTGSSFGNCLFRLNP